MLGKILIYIAFASSGAAALLYFLSYNRRENAVKAARGFYYITTAMIVFASIFLMSNILAHNFQMTYVYEFTSRELPLHLLISAFFSGQEGSFLLWALLLALTGLVLAPHSRSKDYEKLVMGFYSVILLFILLLLAAKSPFDYIWNSYSGQNIPIDYMPQNGRGLNPVLQNFWIIVHPPVLFAGYALVSVPYVFALSGLIKKDYRGWIDIAQPWTLTGAGVLGLGIILGGFWAYETLGWGGFWGWDPVENSSLLPWMASIALVHTLLVQKRNGGLIKTNLFLAILTFTFVIFATFLTRSGVLKDVSVHSFVDPGRFVYLLLMIFMFVVFAAGIFMLLLRSKDLSSEKIDFDPASREFMLSLGTIIILLSTAIILIGTSWPIISGIFSDKVSSVDISYYDKWNIPLVIGMMLSNALSLFLGWRSGNASRALRQSAPAFLFTIAALIVLYVFGVESPVYLVLCFAAIFSIAVNTIFAIKNIGKNFPKTGGQWSHIGLGLLIIGAMASGGYSESKNLQLALGETRNAFGMEFTLAKYQEIEKELKDREKYEYHVRIVSGSDTMTAKPILYLSDFNQRQSPFLEPGIERMVFNDIYVSPLFAQNKTQLPTVSIAKDSVIDTPMGGARIRFKGFDMSAIESRPDSEKPLLGAKIEIFADTVVTDTLYATVDMRTRELTPIWTELPGDSIEVALNNFVRGRSMDDTRAVLAFHRKGEPMPEPVEILGIEVSIKPFINFVWLGSILIFAGFFVAIKRHL